MTNQSPQGYAYQVPPPPVIYQQPVPVYIPVIPSALTCPSCGQANTIINRKVVGFRALCWCLVLFFFTFCLFWIPFVNDRCYDNEVVCIRCNIRISIIRAPCP